MSVLVVDDDDVAIEAVVRALDKQRLDLNVVVASDGGEALRVLRGGDKGHRLSGPLIILLDLNMTGMSGLEFLDAMRADPELHHNVVFVWTTSDSKSDRVAAYTNHVAGYLIKSPTDRQHGYLVGLLKFYRDHVKLRA